MQQIRWSRVVSYIVATCALTLAWVNGATAAGLSTQGLGGMVLAVGMMWMPGLTALGFTRFVLREPVGRTLGLTTRPVWWPWMVAALVVPFALPILSTLFALAIPGVTFDPSGLAYVDRIEKLLPADVLATKEWLEGRAEILALGGPALFLLGLLQAVPAAATINAVAALGEELGWRGYLHRELAPLGFWRSSILVGAVWGLWHAPLILKGHNYPDHPVEGVLLMTVWCVALAPLHTWARARARSIWAAAWFHGSINATAGIGTLLVSGGSDLTIGLTGVAGVVAAFVLVTVLLVRGAPKLEDERSASQGTAPTESV